MEEKKQELAEKLELCKSFTVELKFPFKDEFDQTVSKIKIRRPTLNDYEEMEELDIPEKNAAKRLKHLISFCSDVNFETLGKIDHHHDWNLLLTKFHVNFPVYSEKLED